MAHLQDKTPEGYSLLYKHIAACPELGLFRRFGSFWAKKLHDDTSEFKSSLEALHEELKKYPALGGDTVLDCPLWIVKERCRKDDTKLWNAWSDYDASLMKYGKTLCMSEQVMKLPHQDEFHAKDLATFMEPKCKPIIEDGRFMLTGEDAGWYQDTPWRRDTCGLRDIPRDDFLTMHFIYLSRWIETRILTRIRKWVKGEKVSDADNQAYWKFDGIVAVMDIISCVLASVILAVTVLILAVVSPLKVRIAVVGIAGTVFALSVKLMAGNPSRGEIFAATAAFYAVAVVFLGSSDYDVVRL